jgi:hypothetical protein
VEDCNREEYCTCIGQRTVRRTKEEGNKESWRWAFQFYSVHATKHGLMKWDVLVDFTISNHARWVNYAGFTPLLILSHEASNGWLILRSWHRWGQSMLLHPCDKQTSIMTLSPILKMVVSVSVLRHKFRVLKCVWSFFIITDLFIFNYKVCLLSIMWCHGS